MPFSFYSSIGTSPIISIFHKLLQGSASCTIDPPYNRYNTGNAIPLPNRDVSKHFLLESEPGGTATSGRRGGIQHAVGGSIQKEFREEQRTF